MKSIRSLYITYMGLTEPLLHSQALSYLKILSQKDVKVYILSFEKKQFFEKSDVSAIKEELDKFGIKWFFLRYHKRPQFLSKPYDIIKGIFLAFYISLRERIGVIHARGTVCALIGVAPCLLLRRKMIFDMRGLMAEEYVDAGSWKMGSFRYKIINRAEQYFLRKADETIILTDKTKKILANNGVEARNITIIPSCVDLEKFNFTNGMHNVYGLRDLLNGKTVLMYVGSVGTWYMLSEMINFYAELLKSMDNAVFFILSQTERGLIEKDIPDALKTRIIIDCVRPYEVPQLLNLAHIGIFFIKPCFSKIASCPTKFAEYLACGLPVIINKGIGDTEEIVRENRLGVVIESFASEEYRKKIDEIKELLNEGEALRKRCRVTAEKYFSLAEGAKKYYRVYSKLANVK